MTEEVISVSPDTSQEEAWETIIQEDVRQVPVVQNGTLTGILSRTDLLRDVTPISSEELFHEVKKAMTPDPFTVEPDDTIGKAAEIMRRERIGSLPVVTGDNTVLGIITRTDLFHVLVQMLGFGNGEIRFEYEFDQYNEFLEKAEELSTDLIPISTLVFRKDDQETYKSLFRFQEE